MIRQLLAPLSFRRGVGGEAPIEAVQQLMLRIYSTVFYFSRRPACRAGARNRVADYFYQKNMANIYRVIRVVEDITQLEKEVTALLNDGWKLAGGVTVTLAVGGDYTGPMPTLVFLQAMIKEA